MTVKMPLTLEQVLAQSKKVLDSGLNPIVRSAAIKLVTIMYGLGVLVRYTAGKRTNAEQAALYDLGRKTPGKIVTKCPATYSPHEHGLAIDFVIEDLATGKKILWDIVIDQDKDGVADWLEVIAEAKKLGFFSGRDFKSFTDNPHLEMLFGLSIDDLRAGKKPPQTWEEWQARLGKKVEPPKLPPRDEFAESLAMLVRAGELSSPDYWKDNAVPGGQVKGEYAQVLINKFAKRIGG